MRSLIVFFPRLATAVSGCLLLLLASLAHAYVSPPRIAELVETSQLIVLAKVESIRGLDVLGNRRAKATVKEVWKGQEVETVEYRVSPTFACDIADAKRGETVLLFLKKEKNSSWGIIWSGRGRMPLKRIEGENYLTYYNIVFPKEVDHIKRLADDESGFRSAVELSVVKKLVRKTIDSTK